MKWAAHVTRMRERECCILVGKPEKNTLFIKSRLSLKDRIKMNLNKLV
jgi:hypothetical protein